MATSHKCGLSSHAGSINQNSTVYNKNYNWFCSNDCANYVSQAMYAGGVPQSTTWKPGTSAWQTCVGMKTYFTTTNKWWNTSNYANCNAGGIMMITKKGQTNPYHVMMIVENDTVHRSYSAHTRDRLIQPYSDTYFGTDKVDFYRFENVSPSHTL